jgi:hypothetical protein
MKFALLFAAAFAALPACAVTTYDFSFEGRQTHFFDAWECPSMVCSVPLIMEPWLGEFSVTAPDGDGVFDVTGLSLTNEGDAGIAVSSSGRSPPFSSLTSVVITVTDGTVTSIAGLAPATDELRTLYSFWWDGNYLRGACGAPFRRVVRERSDHAACGQRRARAECHCATARWLRGHRGVALEAVSASTLEGDLRRESRPSGRSKLRVPNSEYQRRGSDV